MKMIILGFLLTVLFYQNAFGTSLFEVNEEDNTYSRKVDYEENFTKISDLPDFVLRAYDLDNGSNKSYVKELISLGVRQYFLSAAVENNEMNKENWNIPETESIFFSVDNFQDSNVSCNNITGSVLFKDIALGSSAVDAELYAGFWAQVMLFAKSLHIQGTCEKILPTGETLNLGLCEHDLTNVKYESKYTMLRHNIGTIKPIKAEHTFEYDNSTLVTEIKEPKVNATEVKSTLSQSFFDYIARHVDVYFGRNATEIGSRSWSETFRGVVCQRIVKLVGLYVEDHMVIKHVKNDNKILDSNDVSDSNESFENNNISLDNLSSFLKNYKDVLNVAEKDVFLLIEFPAERNENFSLTFDNDPKDKLILDYLMLMVNVSVTWDNLPPNENGMWDKMPRFEVDEVFLTMSQIGDKKYADMAHRLIYDITEQLKSFLTNSLRSGKNFE